MIVRTAGTRSEARQTGMAKLVASIAVSTGLLGLTYMLMNRNAGESDRLLRQLGEIQLPWLGAVVLASIANNLVASCRFHLIVRRAAAMPITLWKIVKINAAALFLGFWTPVSVSGDAGRVIWLRKVVPSYLDALLIVLCDRLLALFALVACMLPFIPAYLAWIAESTQMPPVSVLMGAVVVALVAFGAAYRYRRAPRMDVLRLIRALSAREVTGHVLVGLLYVSTFFLAVCFAAQALGLSSGWQRFLAAAPILFLAQNVPITFGGLGSREFSFLILLGPVIGDTSAVTLSLVVGLGFWLASLPGGLALAELAEDPYARR